MDKTKTKTHKRRGINTIRKEKIKPIIKVNPKEKSRRASEEEFRQNSESKSLNI